MSARACEALVARAQVAALLGRPRTADALCLEALAIDPSSVRALELRAWVALELRAYAALDALLLEGLARAPMSAWLHYAAGLRAQRLGRLAEAERSLTLALELEPRCARFRARYARVLASRGAPRFVEARGEAEAAIAQALRATANGAVGAPFGEAPAGEVLSDASLALATSGAVVRAAEVCAMRLAREPDAAWAHVALARVRALGNVPHGCALACAEALRIDPTLRAAWQLRARALAALGNLDGARGALAEARRLAARGPATR